MLNYDFNSNSDPNSDAESSQADRGKRGLASADPLTRERVARAGGKASQRSGKAHKLTPEERRRGGESSHGGGRKPGA